jgi:predicted transcriptional regulator
MVTGGKETARLLGPLGAEVMDVLWSASASGDGPMTVRAVLDRLNRGRAEGEALAYTTVMTVLTRLTERGAARRTPAGRGYAYAAAVRDVAELAVRDVVRDHGEAALSYFVDAARTDPRLAERLQRLLSPGEPTDDTGAPRKEGGEG